MAFLSMMLDKLVIFAPSKSMAVTLLLSTRMVVAVVLRMDNDFDDAVAVVTMMDIGLQCVVAVVSRMDIDLYVAVAVVTMMDIDL